VPLMSSVTGSRGRMKRKKRAQSLNAERLMWAGAGASDVRCDDHRFRRDGEERERMTSGIWIGAGIGRVRERVARRCTNWAAAGSRVTYGCAMEAACDRVRVTHRKLYYSRDKLKAQIVLKRGFTYSRGNVLSFFRAGPRHPSKRVGST
jgi:hypothetical protein